MNSSKCRYLFIKHSPNWNVDRVTRWMKSQGKTVDWCYPVDEDPFPDPDAYTGIVVFGGANSANDSSSHEWVHRELRFVEDCLKKDTAFLGICLGAQILARALGSEVRPHEKEIQEVGFCRVDPVDQSNEFLKEPLMVMQWHSEGFDLPQGATQVAKGDDFPNQAYALNDHVYGMQYHPEVNSDVLAIWHERNKTRTTRVLTEQQRVDMMADAHKYDHSISQWLYGFLEQWVQVCETRRS